MSLRYLYLLLLLVSTYSAYGSSLVVSWGDASRGGDSSSVASELYNSVSAIYSTDWAFAALKDDGSVVTWGPGNYGGDSSVFGWLGLNIISVASELSSGVTTIYSNEYAFAALKDDGSVVTWGDAIRGGDSSSVASELSNGVSAIYSTSEAFAALKADGSVVTWGQVYTWDSSSVASELSSGVTTIFTTNYTSFAALKEDGSVVSWGAYGRDSSSVASELSSGVTTIYSTEYAFAALKDDGSVVTWGLATHGGDSSSVASELSNGVTTIYSNVGAFAALKDDGSVVTWGGYGGDSSSVASELLSDVSTIYPIFGAFAALKNDGSVVTWGDGLYGGDSSSVASELSSGVTTIYSTERAFAALKPDGSVVTWGDSASGGDSSSVEEELSSGVTTIYSTSAAFAALKDDGSVVTWGDSASGGDSSSVEEEFSSGVSTIYSNSSAFVALVYDIDTDEDGKNNGIDIDDDNDGITDAYDPSPLVYDVSENVPTSLSGYVEIFFSDNYPGYGIWYGSGENSSINIMYEGADEIRFQDSYSWNSQNLTSTGYYGGGTFRTNFKNKTNDLFFKFTYVSESSWLYNDDSGKGFFYDGRMDLDNNGMADGEQITNGLPFPAADSIIDLANVYSSAESNLIPIQVLDYASNEKYFPSELKDLRPGSTMIEVNNGWANIHLELEVSNDLESWIETHPSSISIPADTNTKFFRFKMAD